MDDLKEIQSESSYNDGGNGNILMSSGEDENDFSGMPLEADDHRVDGTNSGSNNLWDSLEKDIGVKIEKEIDASEFTGGAESEYDAADNDGYESSDSGALDLSAPEGFGDLPASERFMSLPSAEEEKYSGPSSDPGYQSADDLFSPPPAYTYESASDDEATRPVGSPGAGSAGGEDKTISIQQDLNLTSSLATGAEDKTLAVDGFANARLGARKNVDVDVKVSVGNFRGSSRTGAANVLTSVDASLAQAENLKLAQQRILELEKETEHLRAENEELASAGEIIRSRTDELSVRISSLEKEKEEVRESAHSEILILKGNLQYKENEVAKARIKVDELETRLKSDFKKIRVRERELENRLELLRAEKAALVRSKDEYILDQKRKIDQLSQELDNYRKKCLELNKTLEANQDQFKRTERALRLALTNLEVKEENLTPFKKAE